MASLTTREFDTFKEGYTQDRLEMHSKLDAILANQVATANRDINFEGRLATVEERSKTAEATANTASATRTGWTSTVSAIVSALVAGIIAGLGASTGK